MKKFFRLRTLIMTLIVTMMFSMQVFAISASSSEVNEWLKSNYETYKNDLSSYLLTTADANHVDTWENNGIKYYYSAKELSDKINDIIVAQQSAQQSQAESDQKLKDVQNLLDENLPNIQPDVKGALITFEGVQGAISWVIGMAVILITVGMTLFTATDIFFLTFPPFQQFCESVKVQGASGTNAAAGFAVSKARSEKAGSTRLKFVTDEAEYAYSAAQTAQTGKSAIVIYFGKRAFAIVFTTIALFILVTGNITIITNIALKAVSGIIELINKMAA